MWVCDADDTTTSGGARETEREGAAARKNRGRPTGCRWRGARRAVARRGDPRALLDARAGTTTGVGARVGHRAATAAWRSAVSRRRYPWVAFAPRVAAGALSPAAFGALWLWPWVGMSLIWTTMTQVSHIQEACQPAPLTTAAAGGDDRAAPDMAAAAAAVSSRDDKCWAARQVAASLDYSVGSPLVTACAAGLNSQSLHHVLPCVCSCHHPAIYDECVATKSLMPGLLTPSGPRVSGARHSLLPSHARVFNSFAGSRVIAADAQVRRNMRPSRGHAEPRERSRRSRV